MNRYTRRVLATMLIAVLGSIFCHAQVTETAVRMTDAQAKAAAKTITSRYGDWKTAEISGKFNMEKLPVKPSAKIFMKKGERITISLRVILMGEVATINITPTHFTMINKMNRTYCHECIDSLIDNLPVTIDDLQDIFLNRLFIPQEGTLSMKNYSSADFYNDAEGWLIIPRELPADQDLICGYATFTDGRTQFIAVSTFDQTDQAVAEYEYSGKSTDIEVRIRRNSKDFKFGLQLDNPDLKPKKEMPEPEIPSGYTKFRISSFLKNL